MLHALLPCRVEIHTIWFGSRAAGWVVIVSRHMFPAMSACSRSSSVYACICCVDRLTTRLQHIMLHADSMDKRCWQMQQRACICLAEECKRGLLLSAKTLLHTLLALVLMFCTRSQRGQTLDL